MTNIHPHLFNGRKSDQSIWEIASSSVGGQGIHKVGTRASLQDGRVFYYAKSSGAAIIAGNLLSAELQTAEFADLAVGTLVIGGGTITPTLGSTAVTLNEYAGGYCCVTDSLGEGITYEIVRHPLAAGSGTPQLTLEDPINVSFDGDTTVQMVKNLWCDVIIAPTAAAHIPVGVSNTAVIAGTSNPQYFWCQTWGICSVLQDEGPSIGQGVGSGPDVAGSVGVWNAPVTPEPMVGISVWTGVQPEFSPVMLMLHP